MEKSTVYFTDFRCPVGTSQLDKLKKLCVTAGIKDIDMDGKFVAIKMHFGELGNLAFLRPNYAKAVADLCKEQGGLPFLTDCNTLYPGSRKNALEHLECANLNGFNRTQECDFLLLDEILALPDYGITTAEAIGDILKMKDESMHILLTGRTLPDSLRKYADSITTLTTEIV